MGKCKKCASSQGVYGFEDAPYMEIASAVVGAIVSGKVDEMITTDATGATKDNYLTNNPNIKSAAFLAAGIGLTAFMKGEMYKGAGIGLATYGAYQLYQTAMAPAVTGLSFMPPRNIAGVNGMIRTLPGNYGIAQPNIGSVQGSNYGESDLYAAQKYNSAKNSPVQPDRMKVGNLVRAL